MEVDFEFLASEVRSELDGYVVPEHPPEAVGSPLPLAWYEAGLAAMRTALVQPYWTEMRDMDPKSRKLIVLKVVVVVDDGEGSLVAFDPSTENEFVLALRYPDPDLARGVNVVSCGVRGDAVGCFLSR